jgi:hypothetical protein
MSDKDTAEDRGDNFTPDIEIDSQDAVKAAADAAAEVAALAAKGDAEKEAGKEKEDAKAASEDDADTDTDTEKEAGKGKKDQRIPLSRHKEMLDKSRAERDALAAEVNRLKQSTKSAATNATIDATEEKLVGMEEKYTDLLGKGELAEATKLMTEIRKMERTINDAKSDAKAQAASEEAYARVKYDTVLSRVEEAYPALNEDHEDYDETAAGQVVTLFNKLVRAGDDRASALQEAVKLVMPAISTKQKTATEVDPRVTAEQLAKERKAEGLRRNVDASKRQPASTTGIGQDSDKGSAVISHKEVKGMSQEAFAKLKEDELSVLRGDSV